MLNFKPSLESQNCSAEYSTASSTRLEDIGNPQRNIWLFPMFPIQSGEFPRGLPMPADSLFIGLPITYETFQEGCQIKVLGATILQYL
jgi:hypothetical protein